MKQKKRPGPNQVFEKSESRKTAAFEISDSPSFDLTIDSIRNQFHLYFKRLLTTAYRPLTTAYRLLTTDYRQLTLLE